jgi:hypothetical protein
MDRENLEKCKKGRKENKMTGERKRETSGLSVK